MQALLFHLFLFLICLIGPSQSQAICSSCVSCGSNTAVVFPSNVTSIANSAFMGCTTLISIIIPSGVTTIGVSAFKDCTSLATVTIASTVNSIGGSAFMGCTALTSITLPPTVSTFSSGVFQGCSSLTSVVFPSGVTSLPTSTFVSCSSLSSVTLPNSIYVINNNAFQYCTALTSITLPANLVTISSLVFQGSGLTSISIPSSVTTIGNSAFSSCASLTSLTLPHSVTSVSSSLCFGCTSLTSVVLSTSTTVINANAFYGSSALTAITIPSTVTTIGNYAFRGCSSLSTITLPKAIKSLGAYAFQGCTGLGVAVINANITVLNNNVFEGCTSLAVVSLPNSLKTLSQSAFYGCSRLESITIPPNVTFIDISVFGGCSALTSMIIPPSVTTLGTNVFLDCTGLVSVTLPSTLTSIAVGLFQGCTSLSSITIPSSVITISNGAFSYCSSLVSVTVPNQVTTIGNNVFYGCLSLTTIVIPNSVTTIGNAVFCYCPQLTSITIPASFSGSISSGCTVSPTIIPTVVPTTIRPSRSPTKSPTYSPTSQPTNQPSNQPSSQPSRQPSSQPTVQPTRQPSRQPTSQPSSAPSVQPTLQPTTQPTSQPTRQPSSQPTSQPSRQPSSQPSTQPSMQPTIQPSSQPSSQPTSQPSSVPSSQPTLQPSMQPTRQPSSQPSSQPTVQPSTQPSCQPSCQPSKQPSSQPSGQPTIQPSAQPSTQPSLQPTAQPSRQPSSQPSIQPSAQPTTQPSTQPTLQPTTQPTTQPSRQPSIQPTSQPSRQPSIQPTDQPTVQPSSQPSCQPSSQPTRQPSRQPSSQPSGQPSVQPSTQPSCQPSCQPSRQPSSQPSGQPTVQPSSQPSTQPSSEPTAQPSQIPSSQPTEQPSQQPSSQPSLQPSSEPTTQPTTQPSSYPSAQPSLQPSGQPTGIPSSYPTQQPSIQPSTQPSTHPSTQPSTQPSIQPTTTPTSQPSSEPTAQPSSEPSAQPLSQPTFQPSAQPSFQPTTQPSIEPSSYPTVIPSFFPSDQPSIQPTSQPTKCPSLQPLSHPSSQPSMTLSSYHPSVHPVTVPVSVEPSNQPTGGPKTQSTSPTHSTQPTVLPIGVPSCVPTCLPSYQPTIQPTVKLSAHPTTSPLSLSMQPSCSMITSQRPSDVLTTAKPTVSSYVTLNSITPSSLNHFNSKSSLVVTCTIQSATTCTAKWSIQNLSQQQQQINITMALSTPIQTLIEGGFSRLIYFNLLPSTMLPGSSYAVRIKCGVLTSSLFVQTNQPPASGSFNVLPSSGTELQTMFTLLGNGWNDTDLPLTYQFAYSNPVSSSVVYISPRKADWQLNTTLPSGNERTNRILTTNLIVSDCFDASTERSYDVQVLRIEDMRQLNKLILAQLNVTANVKNAESLLQTLAVASSTVTRVNCTTTVHCKNMNRFNCSSVAHSCGPCLPGFLGAEGHQNTPCTRTASLIGFNIISNVTTTYCHSSAACSSWQFCNAKTNQCEILPKICPNDCSNRGKCVKQNIYTYQPTLKCDILDISCDVSCSCSNGFGGTACEMTKADVDTAQQVTNSLLSSLFTVMAVQNKTHANLLTSIAVLKGLSSSTTNLNSMSLSIIQQIADHALDIATETASSTSFQDLYGILTAIDAGLTAALIQKQSMQVNFTKSLFIINKFCSLLERGTFPGEQASYFSLNTFRLSSIRLPVIATNTSVAQLPIPSTPLEEVLSVGSSYSKVDSIACSATSACTANQSMTLQIIEISSALLPPQPFVSNQSLHVTSNIIAVNLAGIQEVHIVVRNTIPISNHARYNFTSHCTQQTLHKEQNYTCPDSNYVIRHFCNGQLGVKISYCPPLQHACSQLNTTTSVLLFNTTICQLINYTEQYTSCACKIGLKKSSRRRLDTVHNALDSSGSLALSSMVLYEMQDIRTSFAAASSLTTPEAVEKSLVVILMFSLLWTIGISLLLGYAIGKWKHEVVPTRNEFPLEEKVNNERDCKHRHEEYERIYLKLIEYIQLSFPYAFHDIPFYKRLVVELWTHHKYISFVSSLHTAKTVSSKLWIQGFQILSIHTILMFLLALFYDLQAPSDDGSCRTYLTEVDCIGRKSYLDDSQSFCQWTSIAASTNTNTASIYYVCEFADAEITVKASLYIAIIVSSISSLINRPFDYLFDILHAPLLEENEDVEDVHRKTNLVVPNPSTFVPILPMVNSTPNIPANPQHIKRQTVNMKDVSNSLSTYQKHPSSSRFSLLQVIGSIQVVQSNVRDIPEETMEMYQRIQHTLTTSVATSYQVLSQKQLAFTAMYHDQLKITVVDNRSKHHSKDSRTRPSLLPNDSNQAFINPISLDYQSSPFTLFQNELLIQFQVLTEDSNERTRYIHQWGIEDGNTVNNMKQWMIFSQEIRAMQQQSQMKIKKLKKLDCPKKSAIQKEKKNKKTTKQQDRLSSDTQIGHELLHIFVLDLLGRTTPAAIIYHGKMDAEYRYTRVVSKVTKILVVVVIVALNAFFAYYAVLKGYVKGITWQYNYLLACIMQMIAEVLFFETMETFWMDFFIPSFALQEVQRAFHQVHTVLHRLCFAEEEIVEMIESPLRRQSQDDALFSNNESNHYFFNCAEHFFLSTKIAKAFPHIMESMMILSYTNPYPGELAHIWKRTYEWTWKELLMSWSFPLIYGSATNRHESSSSSSMTRHASFITLIIIFLQWFVAFPYELQRMMVRFVMPFVLSGLIMVWQMINNRVVGYSITGVVLVLVGCLLLYLRAQPETKQGSIVPQPQQRNNEDAGQIVGDRVQIPVTNEMQDSSPLIQESLDVDPPQDEEVQLQSVTSSAYEELSAVYMKQQQEMNDNNSTEEKVNHEENDEEEVKSDTHDSDKYSLLSYDFVVSDTSDSENIDEVIDDERRLYVKKSSPDRVLPTHRVITHHTALHMTQQKKHVNAQQEENEASDVSSDDDEEDSPEDEINSVDIISFHSL